MKRYLPFAIIAVVLLAAIGGALLLFRSSAPQQKQQPQTATNSPAASATPNYEGVPGAEPPHVRSAGNDAKMGMATVTLEEFGDFQCPPCGLLYPEVKKIESDYGSRLRVIFRNLPLAAMHKNAFDAARAAEAAGLQGKFWEMHDKLYETQAGWSNAAPARPIFVNDALSLGLNVERFTRDMDGQLANSRILLDMKRADSFGIKATPTVLVNDRALPGITPAEIRAAIDAELGKASK